MAASKGSQMLAEVLAPPEFKPLTQVELAKRLDVSPQAVWNWVNGRSRPSYDLMIKLRDETGVPIDAWAEPAPAATGTEG